MPSRIFGAGWLAISSLLCCPIAWADQIDWRPTLEAAQRESAATGKPILLHFSSSNCPPCRRLEQGAFRDPSLVQLIDQQVIPCQVQVEQMPEVAQRYRVQSWPTDLYLSPSGSELHRTTSPQSTEAFERVVRQVALRSDATKSSNERVASEEPSRTTGRFSLPRWLRRSDSDTTARSESLSTTASDTRGPESSIEGKPTKATPARTASLAQGTESATAVKPTAPDRSAPPPPASATRPVARGVLPSDPPSLTPSMQKPPESAVRLSLSSSDAPQATNSSSIPGERRRLTSSPTDSLQGTGRSRPVVAARNETTTDAQKEAIATPASSPSARVAGVQVEPSRQRPTRAMEPLSNRPVTADPVAKVAVPFAPTLPAKIQTESTPKDDLESFSGNRSQKAFSQRAAATSTSKPTAIQMESSPQPTATTSDLGRMAKVATQPDIANLPNQLPQSLALEGYCPVTLADEKRWQMGSPELAVRHRNRVYHLSSTSAKEKFLATPDRFAPICSGMDIVVYLEEGRLIEGKRELGCRYQDRVYLFSSQESKQKFLDAKKELSKGQQRGQKVELASGQDLAPASPSLNSANR
jgi:thiol-disulfide isomerase/thioredoxin